jgi:flavodoxin
MNALVLYDSKFGNTERIAETIALAFQEAVTTRLSAIEDVPDLAAALAGVDVLIVGGPTQMHGVSAGLRHMVESLADGSLKDVRTAAFDTRLHGMKLVTGSAAVRLERLLRRRGAWLVVPPASFIVASREGPLQPGEVEHANAWAAEVMHAVGVRAPAHAHLPV